MSEAATPKAESIALYYQNASSDKEYHVHLKEKDGLWLVEFQYGKRGSALRSGLKTKDPIDFKLAKATYDKTVQGQLKDGYTPSETGAAYQDTPREKLFTGTLPQLLNPVDEDDFEHHLSSKDWMLQEKFDGERLMLRKAIGAVQATNRNGLAVAAPKAFEEALASLPCKSCLLDNEWLGDKIAVFDLLEIDGRDLTGLPAKERKSLLDALLAQSSHGAFLPVETAHTEEEKRALHARVKAANGEGVVAKRIDSAYKVGRPNSGGDQIKRKFVESCTCVVTAQHATKRSVTVAFVQKDKPGSPLRDRGSVTIPVNYEIPNLSDIVEVLYLYAYREGSLYQPIYKGKRHDQGLEDCHEGQLKFKAEPLAAEPASKKVAPRR